MTQTELEAAQARIKELEARIDGILGYDMPSLFDGWTAEDEEEYAQTSPTEMFNQLRRYNKLFYPQWENAPDWADHAVVEVTVHWMNYHPATAPVSGRRDQTEQVSSTIYREDE